MILVVSYCKLSGLDDMKSLILTDSLILLFHRWRAVYSSCIIQSVSKHPCFKCKDIALNSSTINFKQDVYMTYGFMFKTFINTNSLVSLARTISPRLLFHPLSIDCMLQPRIYTHCTPTFPSYVSPFNNFFLLPQLFISICFLLKTIFFRVLLELCFGYSASLFLQTHQTRDWETLPRLKLYVRHRILMCSK